MNEGATGVAILGLPREQKIGVTCVWVQESEIGEECREFWAKPWRNKAEKKTREKFAEEVR